MKEEDVKRVDEEAIGNPPLGETDEEEIVFEIDEQDDGEKNEADDADNIEEFEHIEVDTEEFGTEELFAALDQSLMQQVQEELDAGDENQTEELQEEAKEMSKKGGKLKKVAIVTGSILLALTLLIVFLVGTRPGRNVLYWMIGKYVEWRTGDDTEDGTLTPVPTITETPDNITGTPNGVPDNQDNPDNSEGEPPIDLPDTYTLRQEDYVKNFLVFGIEQIGGGCNTDTMMIATINTKDKSVKLTSILRDMYVELEDGKGRKLNSVYARGRRDGQGPELLMATLEKYFRIDLEGYAYVNFDSFEKIVNLLGGVTIELGEEEAHYLNTTNYISNVEYRNVKKGVNRLNGNQVVGYCRVRKVPTLGGAANDYGRTVRQRRVLAAIFDEYKSKNLFELLSITDKCISYVTTNLNAAQISELLEMLVENGITKMETSRIPINDSFYDSGRTGYNGVTYGLVVDDMEANIKYLFQYLYADTEEEAAEHYEQLEK